VNDAWRWRLRDAIDRTGRTDRDVARGAGLAPATLSRLLNDDRSKPWLLTLVRLASELGVTVGWLLNEPEFRIGEREREQLRDAVHVILRLTGE
jgi:transcriptional regulator with XRE-family HTH domain